MDSTRKYWHKLILPIIFLILAIIANKLSTDYVNSLSYHGIEIDILHNLVPMHYIYSVLSEVFLLLAVLVFFFHVIYKKHYDKLPYYIVSIAIFYTIRAIILPLTPLETPYTLSRSYGILSSVMITGGTIPSGHTGLVFLMFFMITVENKLDKFVKYLCLSFAILTGLFVILGRGHYTIDVVVSIFIAFTIYTLMKKYDTSEKTS